jgi:NSS family neurotransmitter:Na+ symporter
MFANAGLRDQLAAATDPVVIAGLEDQLFYINASRALLTAAFIGLGVLVFVAARRRNRRAAS